MAMLPEKQKPDNLFDRMEVDIKKHGTQIVLPSQPREMTEDEAIKALQRKRDQLKQPISIHEEVNAFPLEGAYALMRVLQHKYGWADAVPKPGFFGDTPPKMVTLETGYGQTTQVIWGQFEVPNVEGRIETGIAGKNGRAIFVIRGTVLKKHQAEIKEIADLVRQYCAQHSLYKAKAIKIVTKENSNGGYEMDLENPPQFLDLSRVNERELTFSDNVYEQVKTNLFTPIERTEECRAAGIPLKRNVLLEGRYGTGKTLTAFVTAQKAIKNGWTFLYLDRVSALKDAVVFARQYSPCVIFAEDVERVVSGGRSVGVDDVLNNIDGIDSKGQEIICIFTTNHLEKIEKAMLRPGRLDAIITVEPPDAKAAEKLIRTYSQGLIAADEDLSEAGTELAGQIPAVIREVTERSKLFAIGRSNGEAFKLTGYDVKHSAIGMKKHLELMAPKAIPSKTKNEALGELLAEVVAQAVISHDSFGTITTQLKDVHTATV